MSSEAVRIHRQSKAVLRAACDEIQNVCGRPPEPTTPVMPLHGAQTGSSKPWAFIVGLLVAIFVLAILAGCVYDKDGKIDYEGSGDRIKAAGKLVEAIPHPIAFPIGAVIALIGGAVSAIGKIVDKPKVLRAGVVTLALGAGGEGVNQNLDAPPIVAGYEYRAPPDMPEGAILVMPAEIAAAVTETAR